jgi:hypothetical protein
MSFDVTDPFFRRTRSVTSVNAESFTPFAPAAITLMIFSCTFFAVPITLARKASCLAWRSVPGRHCLADEEIMTDRIRYVSRGQHFIW